MKHTITPAVGLPIGWIIQRQIQQAGEVINQTAKIIANERKNEDEHYN